jgi:hypothetical protein
MGRLGTHSVPCAEAPRIISGAPAMPVIKVRRLIMIFPPFFLFNESDVEETCFLRALKVNIEDVGVCPYALHASCNQGFALFGLFDQAKTRIVSISCHLILEVKPRQEAKIDAARDNPNQDTRQPFQCVGTDGGGPHRGAKRPACRR